MTYIIDLQKLWDDRAEVTLSHQQAAALAFLDPNQRVISAVVVAKEKDGERLFHTLKSLLSQLFIREIIIVLNENFADLEKKLEHFSKRHPRCYITTVKPSLHIAKAYQVGAQFASCQYLLFVDASCLLPKNAVLKLLATGIRKPQPWLIGLKPDEDQISNNILSKMTNYYSAPQNPEVTLPGGGEHALEVGGDCLLVPAKTFIELGGLENGQFHTSFHLDLCLRIHLAGGGVYQVKDLHVLKEPGLPPSLSSIMTEEWQTFRARGRFHYKYVSKKTNILFDAISYGVFGVRFLASCCLRGMSYLLQRPTKSIALAKPRTRLT